MTIDELLPRLDGVRKSGRGWRALCKAHNDRRPSLSIREGVRGILLKCWAGCELSPICAAIGITTRQLFFDDNGPIDRAAIQRQRFQRQAEHDRKRVRGRRTDGLREAAAVIRAATGIDISGWTDEQLDAALNAVCDAREFLDREDADAIQHAVAEA